MGTPWFYQGSGPLAVHTFTTDYYKAFYMRCIKLNWKEKIFLQEIKESVELPLTHPEYYEEMGIRPPKGVILYGPPGTGKTLLAKAVANQTSATFLRVVGSELVSLLYIHFIQS